MCKTTSTTPAVLYKCEPEIWVQRYPVWLRDSLAYVTMFIFSFCFLLLPVAILAALVLHFFGYTNLSLIVILAASTSFIIPAGEWVNFRKLGQLWYKLLDFSSNLSPEDIQKYIKESETQQFILGMHPHGIIPFHGVLYAAFCDQYMPSVYGFGAAANVVLYLPFLRNIMGFLSVSSADYNSLRKRLLDPELFSNAYHKSTRHLFLLPGGIAEVYTSTPKKHVIVFKKRTGLVRLSLETGAALVPVYVFGGTDFFENVVAGDNLVSRLARKLRMGLALFYGHCFLPLPYTPKVTFCYGEPLPALKWDKEKGAIPESLVTEIHAKYIESLTTAFDKYKALAGYPDAVLEIV